MGWQWAHQDLGFRLVKSEVVAACVAFECQTAWA